MVHIRKYIHTQTTEFEINMFLCFQPVKLTEEWGDLIKPQQQRVGQSSSSIYNLLDSPKLWGNTGPCCVTIVQTTYTYLLIDLNSQTAWQQRSICTNAREHWTHAHWPRWKLAHWVSCGPKQPIWNTNNSVKLRWFIVPNKWNTLVALIIHRHKSNKLKLANRFRRLRITMHNTSDVVLEDRPWPRGSSST